MGAKANMIRSVISRKLNILVMLSLATSGTAWIVPVHASDAPAQSNAPVSQETFGLLRTGARQRQIDNQEVPVFPSPLNWEKAQSPVLTDGSIIAREDTGNLLLLQEPGPAQAPAPQPVTGPPPEKQATQVNVITGLGNVRSDDYRPLTGKQRWQYYLNQNFVSTGAYFGPVLASVIDQANGEPPEWGGGMEGYGRRLASRLGTGVVQNSAQSAGCALLGQEPRYIRSSSPQVLSRIGHAFLFSLITYNREGKIRLALPTLASYYAAGMTATLWMPERYTALGDGVRDGNRQVILAGLVNQFQEFWPDIKRIFSRRH
jgi:hypothetical protein